MLDILKSFFTKSAELTINKSPEGLCPNCWGNQEYDHTIRTLYKDKQIDVNNHKAHHAFIQEFVVNHVKGITLIKGNNGIACPTCKTVFPNP